MALGTSLPARIPAVTPVQTRYISPSGSDASGDGSIGNPWKTPSRAFSQIATTGGLIYCRGGTYTLTGDQTWSRAGNSGNPVQIRAYPGETPVFQGNFRFSVTGQYLRFGPGLQLTGPGANDLMKITAGGNNIEVVGCKFTMTTTQELHEGLIVTSGGGSPPVFQVWDCEFVGNGSLVTNKNHCLYVSSSGSGSVIANCVIRDMAAGYGIQMYPGASNLIVTCCTIDANSNRSGIIIGGDGSNQTSNARVIGCIITNCQGGVGITWEGAAGSGNNVSDCIGDNSGTDFASGSGVTNTNNLSSTDPLYNNAAGNDFTLQEDSPAYDLVNVAREGYVPVLDKNGAARTTADAGAYSTGGVAPPPDPPSAPVNTVAPSLSGDPTVGETLTVTNGTWQGQATITFARVWLRDGTPIGGETGLTYLLDAADLGATITVEVTATNGGGSSEAVSNGRGPVGGPTGGGSGAPVNTSAPSISGTPQIGNTLTAAPGEWDGDEPMTFSYQWYRRAAAGTRTAIGGATAQTYTTVSADSGRYISVDVTATN